MPDLKDGESVEMQGSAIQPYVLKNVDGVFSCSCPAWRNQSLPIDRRTCKHLRKLRGDDAERERIGSDVPDSTVETKAKPTAPPLLLAHRWENDIDLTGWWFSEKLDGVRAWWDGKQFLSRQGNRFHAPEWFTKDLPRITLDGELWIQRQAFQRTVGIVRRQNGGDLWKQLKFMVFDAPQVDAVFETRCDFLEMLFRDLRPRHAKVLDQHQCRRMAQLRDALRRVESQGGEGLMLRQPESRYEIGRSHTLLKVKSFQEADARVVEHLPGRGRHKGRLGALAVELPDGTRLSVGTGLTDRQRESPPPIGSSIMFRYQELTDGGVPRFPSFVRVRTDQESASR